jgi:hypothetical protein
MVCHRLADDPAAERTQHHDLHNCHGRETLLQWGWLPMAVNCHTRAPTAKAGAWCSRPVTAWRTGGRPQRFCAEHCRRASEKGIRDWGEDPLAEGGARLAELQRAGSHPE